MSTTFDLFVLPIQREHGQEQVEMPGLYAAAPPRRVARGRELDRLLMHLSLLGSAPLPVDQSFLLLEKLADTYYKASGAITSAMLQTAKALNDYLLERNLRNSNTGRQATGLFTLVVLRGDSVFLGHCGPVHSYVLGDNRVRHFLDNQGSGRGLGLSRQTDVRYFQATLVPGSYLLLAHQPPAAWQSETLQFPSGSTLEQVRRRLIGAPDSELSGVVAHVQPGPGKIHLLRVKNPLPNMAQASAEVRPESAAPPAAAAPAAPPLVATETAAPVLAPAAPQPAVAESQPLPPAASAVEPAPPASASAERPAAPATGPAPQLNKTPAAAPVSPRPAVRSGRQGLRPPQPVRTPKAAKPPVLVPALKKGLAGVLRVLSTFRRALKTAWEGLAQFLRKLLPDETVLELSPATLTFLAVAVPMLIALLGAATYLERGQETQYREYYQQAMQASLESQAETDPTARRTKLNKTLDLIETAQHYRTTEEAQQLFYTMREALDQLDGIARLDFQPAIIGGLNESQRITRMAAAFDDLYLLDSSSGSALRAIQTGGGYQVDPSFSCGPTRSPVIVEKLIDLVALPRPSDLGATMIGMDARGTLLFCIPGDKPIIQQIAPPGSGFVSPLAFEYNGGDLYLLDPGNNAVWIYRGLDFSKQPRPFFSGEPPPIRDVIDLAVNGDDLYLLHADGRQTRCTYSALIGAPTTCQDPLPYADRRPGRQDGAVIADAVFNQIYFSLPPDPSLYLLDAPNQAIYHMGLQLSLQRQYRAFRSLPENKATAFALSSARILFLALGNDVFYAALP